MTPREITGIIEDKEYAIEMLEHIRSFLRNERVSFQKNPDDNTNYNLCLFIETRIKDLYLDAYEMAEKMDIYRKKKDKGNEN